MGERLRFVARLLGGEKMAPLCAEFGISPKTGYKSTTGTKTGVTAFSDRSRRPHRQANRLPTAIERRSSAQREYPAGASEDAAEAASAVHGPHLPAVSTSTLVLDRQRLVQRRRPSARGDGHHAVAADRSERALSGRISREEVTERWR